MKIIISSAGLQELLHERVLSSTLLLDCRVMQDPYGVLRESGDSIRVQDWVRQRHAPLVQAFVTMIQESLKPLSGIRGIGGNLSVTCFCAAGICRSRAMKHILGQELTTLMCEGKLNQVQEVRIK